MEIERKNGRKEYLDKNKNRFKFKKLTFYFYSNSFYFFYIFHNEIKYEKIIIFIIIFLSLILFRVLNKAQIKKF